MLIKYSDLPNLNDLTETLFSRVALLYFNLLVFGEYWHVSRKHGCYVEKKQIESK